MQMKAMMALCSYRWSGGFIRLYYRGEVVYE